jgi:hypothetical protein
MHPPLHLSPTHALTRAYNVMSDLDKSELSVFRHRLERLPFKLSGKGNKNVSIPSTQAIFLTALVSLQRGIDAQATCPTWPPNKTQKTHGTLDEFTRNKCLPTPLLLTSGSLFSKHTRERNMGYYCLLTLRTNNRAEGLLHSRFSRKLDSNESVSK